MNCPRIQLLAARAGQCLADRGLVLATAESCTGGGIASAVTDVPGSSGWFDRGFVTYSNLAKEEMLGVRGSTLARHGAVSEAVAREMATGALARSSAHVAVAVTGIAGPGGGTPGKPAGTVCFAWAIDASVRKARDAGAQPGAVGNTGPIEDAMTCRTLTRRFAGDRDAVRRKTVAVALWGVVKECRAGRIDTDKR
uniref:Nicotinamide-nucleotide amidase n=1 Tax=Candidatus Kentrum sp. DK TaxID=2126562 RepID=A0A450RXG6_9GAMM|nr:MAG: nicotinamide-nucleotide amidase [Candidatus Kentron sp. DK]